MVQITIELFHKLGFQINSKKSTLTPTQRLEFMGAYLDSVQTKAILSNHRFMTMNTLISTITMNPQTSVRTCLQLLGHMAGMAFIVKHRRFHMRCLQGWLSAVYMPSANSLSKRVTLLPKALTSLHWWMKPENVCMGIPFQQDPPSLTITTDASLMGWGAHLDHHII